MCHLLYFAYKDKLFMILFIVKLTVLFYLAPDQPKYTYIQTPDDVTAYFRVPNDIKKSDIQINFQPLNIEILIRGKCALTGQLSNSIDSSSSTWILDGEKLV